MVVRLYSYNSNSVGSRELANALGIRRIRLEGSKFQGGPDKTVINWGASQLPTHVSAGGTRIINSISATATMQNKSLAFQRFSDGEVSIPAYTASLAQAQRWLSSGAMVFARTLQNASGGRGIVVMDPEHPDTWNQNANLYVKYVKKKDEYRIHIARINDQIEVIDLQKKGLRNEFRGREDNDFRIRNLANGFVFMREGVNPPECVLEESKKALLVSRLDFGAVDVIYNENQNKAYVLEINTAPGLEGQTVTSYANALRRIVGE